MTTLIEQARVDRPMRTEGNRVKVLCTVGIGQRVGFTQDGELRNGCTLAQLEADIARARSKGAGDEATVARVAPGSTYTAEIIWMQDAP